MAQEKSVFERIEALGKNLQEAKKNKNVLDGRKSEIFKTLKEKYGITTKEQLEKRIKDIGEKKEKIDKKMKDLLDEINQNYDWE